MSNSTSLRSEDLPIERLRGAAMLAVASLQSSPTLPAVPVCIRREMRSHFSRLPPQFAGISPNSTLGIWLRISSVFEANGLIDEAWQVLRRLETLHIKDDHNTIAVRALVFARFGRVARLSGNLEDSARWYRKSFKIARTLPESMRWRDAAPSALLGLGMTYIGLGNYPRAESYLLKVFSRHKRIHQIYRFHTRMALSLVFRKRSRLVEAASLLVDGLSEISRRDPRWPELVVASAEIATDLGAAEAAISGYLAVLAVANTPRVASAALAGLLIILSKLSESRRRHFVSTILTSGWGRHHLGDVCSTNAEPFNRLLTLSQGWVDDSRRIGLSPHDQAILLRGIIMLGLRCGRQNVESIRLASEALQRLCERHQFHEFAYSLESLQLELSAIEQSETEASRKPPFDLSSLSQSSVQVLGRARRLQVSPRAVFA